jgi:hypothetical protein
MNDYDVIVFRASVLVVGVHPVEKDDASRRAVLGARKAAAKAEVDGGQRLLEG